MTWQWLEAEDVLDEPYCPLGSEEEEGEGDDVNRTGEPGERERGGVSSLSLLGEVARSADASLREV